MSNDEPQRFKYNITEVNLWSQFKDESGLVNIPPYKAKLITQKPVYMKQYTLSPEKVEGIQPVIYIFFKQGVIVPTHSPYNTPINPIRKADGTSWRLTQDLRAINSLIIPLAPIVPSANYSKFYTTQSHLFHGGGFVFNLLHPRPCRDSAVVLKVCS